MTFQEIKKMCDDIEYYAGYKLSRDDEEEFRRLVRRVKDDEDLEAEAVRKLQSLYGKYVSTR